MRSAAIAFFLSIAVPLLGLTEGRGGAPLGAPTDDIFNDAFSSGTLGAWGAAAADSGDLSVATTAGIPVAGGTNYGLQALVDDRNALYVEDPTPADETRYRARFLVNTLDFDPGEAQAHQRARILIGFDETPNLRRQFAVVLRRQNGNYSIFVRTRRADGSQASSSFFPLSPGVHSIQIDWQRSSATGVADGSMAIWVDEVLQQTVTNIDTGLRGIDLVRMGAMSLKGGATGTMHFDRFESRRFSFIPGGTVAVPAVTGYTKADALEILAGAGLNLGAVDFQIGAQAGVIAGQQPPFNTVVPIASALDLTEAFQRLTVADIGTVDCYNAPCTQNPDGDVTGFESKLVMPGLEVGCPPRTGEFDPNCTVRIEVEAGSTLGVTCEGGPGDCETTFSDASTYACPSDRSCRIFYSSILAGQIGADAAVLTIKKVALDTSDQPVDGVFEFKTDAPARSVTIQTQNGLGSATFALHNAEFQNEQFGETIQPGWDLELITCDRPGLVQVSGIGGNFFIGTGGFEAGARVTCTVTNRRLPPASTVRTTGVHEPEAITFVSGDSFGLSSQNLITIAGKGKLEFRDVDTDLIPTAGSAFLSFDTTASGALYGAAVLDDPTAGDADTMVRYGPPPAGLVRRQFFPDPPPGNFGFTGILSFGNTTDATYFGGDSGSEGMVTVIRPSVSSSTVNALVWRNFGSGPLSVEMANPTLATNTNFVGISGQLVSAFAYNLDFDTLGNFESSSTGWLVAVADGSPGQLWLRNPRSPFQTTKIADVGNGPRRIRCLPSHSICSVSNFLSDSLSNFVWNGTSSMTAAGTVTVGDGPVGIDLIADGANVKVVSTGFNSEDYTITTLGPDGVVVGTPETHAAPAGCDNPGHAVWHPNLPNTVLLSCFGSDKYAIVEVP